MGVSTRNTWLAGIAAASLFALGGAAFAGGGMGGAGCEGPGCAGSAMPGGTVLSSPDPVLPGAGMGGAGTPGCCGELPKGQSVVMPNVHVAGPHVSVTGAHVSVSHGKLRVSSQREVSQSVSRESEQTFLSGGGAYFAPQGIAPTALSGLNVSGGEERYTETVTETVPVEEEICVDRITHDIKLVPMRAVCIDDTGTPHPASQVSGARRISDTYTGEIYRCMAGTAMQVTLGSASDETAEFVQGRSFSCRKGEALVRQRGGRLICAPQTPQRDCNERSLLRQHGPGTKLVPVKSEVTACVPETRTRMQTVTREVERVRASEPQPILLDGGVGQSVF